MALQTFTASQVLTAAQMNTLQANDYNQTVSTKTGSYVLVAADKGTTIVMNSASATTITVNTSLFAAGDTLKIQNINTGATVVTAGTATVTSAGSLSVPQWGGGVLYFTSASAAVYFPSAVTQSSGGLVRIGSASLSANPTNITNVFSTTYKNYKIVIDNAIASARGYMYFRIGANVSTTIYYYAGSNRTSNGTTPNIEANATNFIRLGNWEDTTSSNIRAIGSTIEIQNPFEALRTTVQEVHGGGSITSLWAGFTGGLIDDTTSYTGFTIGAESGTLSGTVTVYGYANS